MRPILIISHNTRSAGTLGVTKNLINYLRDQDFRVIISLPAKGIAFESKNDKIKIFRCNNHIFIFGILNRVFFDFFIIPYIILRYKPKLAIGLGNYFINRFNLPSKLIIRHPYLLENHNLKFLNYREKFVEYLRSIYFKKSISTASHIFLQSEYMYDLFVAKYPLYKNIASVLANPISPILAKAEFRRNLSNDFLLVYPSRYYPHKNHQFLFNLAKEYKDYFTENNISFLITIDEQNNSAKNLVSLINKMEISNIVKNVGEVSQNELFNIYIKSKAIFFPSQAETFGNGLIEGLFLKLPVIVPDLPYAKTILGEAGVYYTNQQLNSAFKKIQELFENEEVYEKFVRLSSVQSILYPTIDKWFEKLIATDEN